MALCTYRQSTAFTLLPTEVLHSIFDYLWADEILYSFHRINNPLNRAISHYEKYHVNFQSILKRHFDQICRHIRPDQIISLVLSDSDDTPSQSCTFLSLFSIDRFTRLRALTLIDIEASSQSFFSNLHQIKSLISFEVDSLSHLRFIETHSQLKHLIVNKYRDDDYNYESSLSALSFAHIRSLALPYCSYNQLRQILSRARALTSLTISLSISDCTGIDYFAEQRQDMPLALTHLKLSMHTFSK